MKYRFHITVVMKMFQLDQPACAPAPKGVFGWDLKAQMAAAISLASGGRFHKGFVSCGLTWETASSADLREPEAEYKQTELMFAMM